MSRKHTIMMQIDGTDGLDIRVRGNGIMFLFVHLQYYPLCFGLDTSYARLYRLISKRKMHGYPSTKQNNESFYRYTNAQNHCIVMI